MRHMAELGIASPQEQALQLCGHPPGPSNLRGSYGGLLVAWALVWVPGGDPATCTGVSVHTRTRSSLLLPWELAFGCYFGMIFWVRWKLYLLYPGSPVCCTEASCRACCRLSDRRISLLQAWWGCCRAVPLVKEPRVQWIWCLSILKGAVKQLAGLEAER